MTNMSAATENDISRIIYLAAKHRVLIPRAFLKYVQFSELINDIATYGPAGVKVNLDAKMPSIDEHLKIGYEQYPHDPGTPEEYRLRIANIVDNEINYSGQGQSLKLTQKISLFKQLDSFVVGNDNELIGRAEASLKGDTGESEGIIKWKTGLDYLDKAFGSEGCYQGLHVIMGAPGTGKTSNLLMLMGALRKNKVASSIWYFSLETPLDMIRWRMTPIRQKTKFLEDDRIIAGMTQVDEVIERIRANPDPDRIILYDGPDVVSAGGGDGRRFVLEDVFRQLVQIKQMCKAVFVPSQPKRGETSGMSLESVAESWSKAWYSDTVFGLERVGGKGLDGLHSLKITNFKNRFGPLGEQVYFKMDYENFDYTIEQSGGWDMATQPAQTSNPEGDF